MKNTHGGKRKGAGRPKEEPTKVISFRVKLYKAEKLKVLIKKLIKDENTI